MLQLVGQTAVVGKLDPEVPTGDYALYRLAALDAELLPQRRRLA